jgi:FKBP-type peptidyl-prolyl cis-trans isomerase SlyD
VEIAKNTCVVLEYTLRLEDGSFIKGENEPASINFIVGYGQLLPALERRLFGLEDGQEVDFVIPAREAFGEHDPKLVRTKTFDEFPEGRDLQVGKWVVATNESYKASYTCFVKDKTNDAVALDFNHPLAGKDLHYHVKVMHVREALHEELENVRPCEFQKEPSLSGAPQA